MSTETNEQVIERDTDIVKRSHQQTLRPSIRRIVLEYATRDAYEAAAAHVHAVNKGRTAPKQERIPAAEQEGEETLGAKLERIGHERQGIVNVDISEPEPDDECPTYCDLC